MPGPLPPQDALVYVMITMSAVDREMTDKELQRIGHMVKNLPVFDGYALDKLVPASEKCGEVLSRNDGLDSILAEAAGLPAGLHETAYALAVEVAAADLNVKQEELRFLSLLRDALKLDKLICAAIERGARARHHRLPA
jgi:tellurite resistance protein